MKEIRHCFLPCLSSGNLAIFDLWISILYVRFLFSKVDNGWSECELAKFDIIKDGIKLDNSMIASQKVVLLLNGIGKAHYENLKQPNREKGNRKSVSGIYCWNVCTSLKLTMFIIQPKIRTVSIFTNVQAQKLVAAS